METNDEKKIIDLSEHAQDGAATAADSPDDEAPGVIAVTADASGQIFAFAEACKLEEYTDGSFEKAKETAAMAKAQESIAKEDKKLAGAIYETKKRQLCWAEVRAKIEEARVESIKAPGRAYVAVDWRGMLFVTRAKKLRDYGLCESAFYAAFLEGCEVELDVAAEIDIAYRESGEESSEESNEDDEFPEQAVEQTVEENPDEA